MSSTTRPILENIGELPLNHILGYLSSPDLLQCAGTCRLLRRTLYEGVWRRPGAHRQAIQTAWASKFATRLTLSRQSSSKALEIHASGAEFSSSCLGAFRRPGDYDFFVRVEDTKHPQLLLERFVSVRNVEQNRQALVVAWSDLIPVGPLAQENLVRTLETRGTRSRFSIAESLFGVLSITMVALEKTPADARLSPPRKVVSTQGFVGIAESRHGMAYLLSTELQTSWHPWNIHTSIVMRRPEDAPVAPLGLEICCTAAGI